MWQRLLAELSVLSVASSETVKIYFDISDVTNLCTTTMLTQHNTHPHTYKIQLSSFAVEDLLKLK